MSIFLLVNLTFCSVVMGNHWSCKSYTITFLVASRCDSFVTPALLPFVLSLRIATPGKYQSLTSFKSRWLSLLTWCCSSNLSLLCWRLKLWLVNLAEVFIVKLWFQIVIISFNYVHYIITMVQSNLIFHINLLKRLLWILFNRVCGIWFNNCYDFRFPSVIFAGLDDFV